MSKYAALLASAIAIPVAAAAGIATFVLNKPDDTPPPATSAVKVTPPDATHAKRCADLALELPYKLDDLTQRRVTPASEQVVAWGDPEVVLRCGVAVASYSPTTQILGINGVEWVTRDDDGATVWTSVSLPVPVEVTVPAKYRDTAATLMLNPLAAPLLANLS